jgi:hypothetical protein
MNPPIIWYTDHDGIAVPTGTPPPGAVPYMPARPQPIDTAPMDGTWILGWLPVVAWWAVLQWDLDTWLAADGSWPQSPSHWLPLPPAPEEA